MKNPHGTIVLLAAATLGGCAQTQTPTSSPAEPGPPPSATAEPAPTAATVEPEPTATASAAAPSVPDIRERCALEVKRLIECVDEYIPMIVGTRIKLDLPPGTADKGKTAAGRAKLEAAAKKEFPQYYSVEKIPEICQGRQTMVEKMPPEMAKEVMAMGPGCETEKDCAAFVKCSAPFVERLLPLQAKVLGH